MDLPTLGAFVAAIAGAIAGIGGLVVAIRRDSNVTRAQARNVAELAAEAAFRALNEALDRNREEIAALVAKTEELELEVEKCHRERREGAARARTKEAELERKILELEQRRARNLARIEELEAKVAELEARPSS